jgi:hypothetical protein
MSEEQAESCIQTFVEKLNKIPPERIKDWGKAIKVNFIDADIMYWIKFAMSGKVEKVESGSSKKMAAKEAVATINTTVDTLNGLFDGSLDVKGAIGGGSVKIEGGKEALIHIAPAFGL